jgi:predicted transposase YdaD
MPSRQKKRKKRKPTQSLPEHDQSYKKLFSHFQMIKDLLLGFVSEPWVAKLDFATLETVKDSFVSDDLRERYDDIIWRVR